MRYRALSASGDYTFGQGQANFLIDSPQAVAQLISTRLDLWTGEWFADLREGTPWFGGVLGTGTKAIYDLAIRNRVLGTQGVVGIDKYDSQANADSRRLVVSMTVRTLYGQVELSRNL